MKVLFNTHAVLWWDSGGARLSAEARRVIADPVNQVFVSAVSVWEIAVKRRLGKLAFDGSPVAAIGAVFLTSDAAVRAFGGVGGFWAG